MRSLIQDILQKKTQLRKQRKEIENDEKRLKNGQSTCDEEKKTNVESTKTLNRDKMKIEGNKGTHEDKDNTEVTIGTHEDKEKNVKSNSTNVALSSQKLTRVKSQPITKEGHTRTSPVKTFTRDDDKVRQLRYITMASEL